MVTELKVSEFLEKLSSSSPVPGGGGVAALAGALGAALCSMVGSLTSGKKKFADVQDEIDRIIAEAGELCGRLENLIDRDAEVFLPLSEAYGLPADNDQQKAEKEKVMESALQMAASVPYETAEAVYEVLKLHEQAAPICSKLAVSDVGVGCAMLRAAVDSAALNVYINTKMMKDRVYAEDLNDRTRKIVGLCGELADRVYAIVEEMLI